MNNIELLAPAGNLNKLKTAIHFGADAVYLGGKDFSLRAYADNFTADEIEEGIRFAHERDKKVYVTANIFAKNRDFAAAEEYFRFLEKCGADAVLITDPGLIELCRAVAPALPVHLSTQANTLNKYAVRFWAKQGVSRVVLARELSLAEIAEIHAFCPDTELECFVHGAMCISYSGRCLLSNYFTDRDSNRGECVQACRWEYTLTERSKSESPLYVEEDARGTYFLNSKDLNLLENIPALKDAGICSFKIEGRMKSEYYVAVVCGAYRRAIDEYKRLGDIPSADKFNRELGRIAHRDYTKAYLLGDNEKTVNYRDEKVSGTAEFAAVVLDYADGIATVEMRNRFRVGDTLEILSPSESHGKTFEVGNMYDREGNTVLDAKLVQQHLRVSIPYPVEPGDIFCLA